MVREWGDGQRGRRLLRVGVGGGCARRAGQLAHTRVVHRRGRCARNHPPTPPTHPTHPPHPPVDVQRVVGVEGVRLQRHRGLGWVGGWVGGWTGGWIDGRRGVRGAVLAAGGRGAAAVVHAPARPAWQARTPAPQGARPPCASAAWHRRRAPAGAKQSPARGHRQQARRRQPRPRAGPPAPARACARPPRPAAPPPLRARLDHGAHGRALRHLVALAGQGRVVGDAPGRGGGGRGAGYGGVEGSGRVDLAPARAHERWLQATGRQGGSLRDAQPGGWRQAAARSPGQVGRHRHHGKLAVKAAAVLLGAMGGGGQGRVEGGQRGWGPPLLLQPAASQANCQATRPQGAVHLHVHTRASSRHAHTRRQRAVRGQAGALTCRRRWSRSRPRRSG